MMGEYTLSVFFPFFCANAMDYLYKRMLSKREKMPSAKIRHQAHVLTLKLVTLGHTFAIKVPQSKKKKNGCSRFCCLAARQTLPVALHTGRP